MGKASTAEVELDAWLDGLGEGVPGTADIYYADGKTNGRSNSPTEGGLGRGIYKYIPIRLTDGRSNSLMEGGLEGVEDKCTLSVSYIV